MFDRLKSLWASKPERKKRDYLGARLSRNINFIQGLQRQDQEVRRDILSLRAHSRHLAKNNPYMRRYLRTIGGQVVGPDGPTLQSQFRTKKGEIRDPYASAIEAAFLRWARKGTCTVCGRYSFAEVLRMFIRTTAQDGECFLRQVKGAQNPFGYALQFIDADLLDYRMNEDTLTGPRTVVMGVELNDWSRPVAYHFQDFSATNSQTYPYAASTRRIEAAEIIHGYDPERASQTRGVPWAAPVMYLMNMLGHYWEAEVSAARAEAERLGFLEAANGDLEFGDKAQVDPTEIEIESSTVAYVGLPPGVTANVPDLKHPSAAFGEFSKAMLKGIASGLGISYAALASDLTEVSYSSIRQGAIEEREYYQELQAWLIETVCIPVFNGWLEMAVLKGQVSVPAGVSLDKLTAHNWESRGWDWVDPKNDVESKIAAVNARLDTRTRILAERGLNFEDVIAQIAEEEKLMKAAGVEIVPVMPSAKPSKTPEVTGGSDVAA